MRWRRSTSEGREGVGQPGAVATPARAPEVPATGHATNGRRRLGELLVERGALTPEQLERALAERERSELPLGEILIAQGLLDERGLTGALAEQFGVRVVDLRTTTPDPDALAALDGTTARQMRALPLRVDDDTLLVATDHIPTPEALARLQATTGHRVVWVLAPPDELARALDRSFRALDDIDRYVRAFESGEAHRAPTAGPEVPTVDEDAPIVHIVTRIITEAVREGASDIHIEPTADAVRVRFRVDGALHDALRLPVSMAQVLVSRIKIMADMNIVERRRAQDGQFPFEVDGRGLDVRVATVATIWGEKVVLRILDRGRSLLELAALGMPPATVEAFKRHVRAPFGMVICAGPTGSGKTTTLYAALNEINDPERNVTTIEDPVEYVFPSINQIQINEQADITFAGGLKAILRQDPDVILVGEIRDVETARIAVQSALTGHLVLSSLHATDAALALQRLLDMGIESFLVASAVVAVVGQRLLRKICPHCVEEYSPSTEELAFFDQNGGNPHRTFVRGHGCNLCNQTGYSGRTGVYELLHVSDEIRELIVAHASHDRLHALAVSQGMRTMLDEALRLVTHDVTTIAEVIRRVYVI